MRAESSFGDVVITSYCPLLLISYRAETAYLVAQPGDVAGIQAEIMAHGPVEVGYFVFSDFQNYHSGVYTPTYSAQVTGKHAVKLIGWGTEG